MVEITQRVFAPGDRVAALLGTMWDDGLDSFTESEQAYLRLHGHHGHVVARCDTSECEHLHVKWEGVHDGRSPGPTSWSDGTPWHMKDDEIEHID